MATKLSRSRSRVRALSYQVILSLDYKITWQIMFSDRDSDFYSTNSRATKHGWKEDYSET